MIGKPFERTTGIVGIAKRPPVLGKIRLGIKKKTQGGKEYPADVDHFVFDEDLLKNYPAFADLFGEKPKAIEGMIPPFADRSMIFDSALTRWSGTGRILCRGDGQTAYEWSPDGQVKRACPCDALESGDCSPQGTLYLMFPQVSVSGVFAVGTGSIINIKGIESSLDFIASISGGLGGQRVRLRREETTVPYTDKDGKNKSSTHWLLKLEMLGLPKQGGSLLEGWDIPIRALPGPQAALPPGVTDGETAPEPAPAAWTPNGPNENHELEALRREADEEYRAGTFEIKGFANKNSKRIAALDDNARVNLGLHLRELRGPKS